MEFCNTNESFVDQEIQWRQEPQTYKRFNSFVWVLLSFHHWEWLLNLMKTWIAIPIGGLSKRSYDGKLRNVEKHVNDTLTFFGE